MVLEARSSGRLVQLQRTCGEDSERWFGDTPLPGDLGYMILCLAGETGEAANLIKKVMRGGLDGNSAVFRHDMSMELVDVFTYLLNCADILQIDLEAAFFVKRDENEKRFTEQRTERTKLRAVAPDSTSVD